MKTLCLLLTFLLFTLHASALSVSITQTGTAANSCTRTLTASVSDGSGNYTYTWSIVSPAQSWPTINNVATVNLALSATVDVNLSLHDITLNLTTSAAVTVDRILTGSFSTFIPNLFTPNGDGYNDDWIVTDASKAYSPINAYSYSIAIFNAASGSVFAESATATSGHLGVIGGDILWNGKLNGVGAIVPTGVYTYQLSLTNCSQTANFSSSLTVAY
jgi:hypothetical protein